MQTEDIYHLVKSRYGTVAQKALTTGSKGDEEIIAHAFGYEPSQLRSIPRDANLGLSCGNPLATANLSEGEIVVDLGSGGGIDVLLAAQKVGPKGNAIGIDMTKSMLELGRKHAESAGASNISFVEGYITSIPLPDAIANCVISNCVINLIPSAEKHLVFREIFRILKPGGRVSISDILAYKVLPAEIAGDLSLYAGCISGASQIHEYERYLRDVGFAKVMIVDTNQDLNIYKSMFPSQQDDIKQSTCCQTKSKPCCGNVEPASEDRTPIVQDFNEWAGSFQIYAVKD